MTFADNLKNLPAIDAVDRIELYDSMNVRVATIENKPGQQGSLAVFQHLLRTHGGVSIDAAKAGLLLYAEHTEDARRNPGKHSNIDRLLAIESGGAGLSGKIFPKM